MVEYNVYTKPLFADKSETIYRAKEHDELKYISEDSLKEYAKMSNFTDMQSGELDRQAEMMENTYKRHASKRSGPLEVGMIEVF